MIRFVEGVPYIQVNGFFTVIPEAVDKLHFGDNYAYYLADKIITHWKPSLIKELKDDLQQWEDNII